MKRILGIFLILVVMGYIVNTVKSCNIGSETSTSSTRSDDKPINPEIKTDYGTLPGNYTTQDEYYIGITGDKVWHGHRKTFYPGGRLRFDAYYEDGKNIWNEKYDETGNIISSDRK